jgi:RNA polymerase sigma-70 factor (family 1)
MFASHDTKELLPLVAAGDEQAFNCIVDRYWQKIYSVSLTFVKSTHLAEDIVQEVFLKLWEKRASLESIENFDSWLFIIARNRIISVLRKKEPSLIGQGGHFPDMPTTQPATDAAVQLKQLQKIINQGLETLPEQQQRIYRMSREQELTHDEICQELGLARSTVKNNLVKTLNFLRQYLRDQADPHLFVLATLLMYL